MSEAAYKKLVRQAVRAFHSCPPKTVDVEGTQRGKLGKIDITGLTWVVADYMTEQEWVNEDQICNDIRAHPKLLRRVLKYLEKENILMSEHRKLTVRAQKDPKNLINQTVGATAAVLGQKRPSPAEPAAAADDDDEEEAQFKAQTMNFYAVDYPRFFDALQLRLHVMRKNIKDELSPKEALAHYRCSAPACAKMYDTYEIMTMYQPDKDTPVCDLCGADVHKLTATGQAVDEVALKERQARLRDQLRRLNEQLRDMISTVDHLRASGVEPPYYGALVEYAVQQKAAMEAQAAAEAKAARNRDPDGAGGAKGGAFGGLAGTAGAVSSGRYLQDTQVEINLDFGPSPSTGPAPAAAAVPAAGAAARPHPGGAAPPGAKKPGGVLPPWIAKQAAAGASNSQPTAGVAAAAAADDKEAARQAAYAEAYLAQLKQQPQAPAAAGGAPLLPVKAEPGAVVKHEAAAAVKAEAGLAMEGGDGRAVLQEEGAGVKEEAGDGDDLEWEDA